MIDLDWQRSLSMMLLDTDTRNLMHQAGHTVQGLFLSKDWSAAELLKKIKPLKGHSGFRILPNSDRLNLEDRREGLEELEHGLMIEWLVHRAIKPGARRKLRDSLGGRDVRLMLRESLHDLAKSKWEPDYIFLDCPPRPTTACMNGLMASDFVLVPVIPNPTSEASAYATLKKLGQLKKGGYTPNLEVAGVVGSMVTVIKGEAIQPEKEILAKLKIGAHTAYGEKVNVLSSFVRHDPGVKKGVETDALKANFDALFEELSSRIERSIHPNESHYTSAVPS